ncbi:ribonuclease R [Spiroplasma syrphidicola EA-1]|uniref:Ribonuclease R n=1 Tax=Spiroplasma syrphidicola EA-1 TaxID=1276229 RepID=R4U574_9MOLU|nr:ribonuclease R [Spiroplasma syrphidicola]AGM25713.1 ribonuclease R [Spiroplasma syrphidicola EA-1]
MKEKIIRVLKEQKRALSSIEIAEFLQLNNIDETKTLLKTLVEMENEHLILVNNNNSFSYLDPQIYLTGVVLINKKGFGFVRINNQQEEYYVGQKDLKDALDNDEVIFRLKKNNNLDKSKKVEAEIVKVIKRKTEYVVGVIRKNKENQQSLEILNAKLQQYRGVIINPEQYSENEIVKGVITNFSPKKNIIEVKVTEIIGNLNQPGADILAVLYEFNIKTHFEPQVLEEANHVASFLAAPEELTCRRDLTKDIIVTIDGDDAKDLDDAISVTKTANDTYLLKVAIADVAHYVKENKMLDQEALSRGCSVYLIDRVVPMLPEKLSNGVCSLNPNEIRLVMCCEMEISREGKVLNSEIYEGYIKTKARLTYNNVNKFFNDQPTEISIEVQGMLKVARELYQVLARRKHNDGSLDFDLDEPKFITNESGKIEAIVPRERGEAEKLIESFMIRANETVAETIFWMDLPFVYRVHQQPKEKKLRDLYEQLSLLGLNIKGKLENIHAKDIQTILEKLKNYDNFKVLSALFLRSMEKARYSPVNDGHFGLASTCYTHFTSPIRRYPDLLVHRLLKQYLLRHQVGAKILEDTRKVVSFASEQSTICEQKAMDCEREVNKMKEAEYMEDKIGNHYWGIVSGVTGFGIFVELENTIEGLVHIRDLKGDYYRFDEKTLKLIGEHTRKEYFLGQKLKIKVKNANKKLRQIDFELVRGK